MAERIVSPGVFTQERDQSFLAQGVAQIGAAFVGPTTKGPAFIPTQVLGQDGFVTKFGDPTGTSFYMGYAIQNYLQEAGSATIVRVLGLQGYSTPVINIYATGSAGRKLFAVLHPTTSGSAITSVAIGGTTGSFSLAVSSSGDIKLMSRSGLTPVEGTQGFIGNILSGGPQDTSTERNVYTYAVFPNALTQAGPGNASFVAETASLNLTKAYANATTPWITSQPINGVTYKLFRFHTLNDGVSSNGDIKVSITNIKPTTDVEETEYGTFDVEIRKFSDTDSSIERVQTIAGLTLDPTSADYIALRIGNSAPTYDSTNFQAYYDGDFRNLSDYIRVEMYEATPITTALPYGFSALYSTVSGSQAQLSSGSYVTTRIVNGTDTGVYYGFDFTNTDSKSYLGPIISTSLTVGSDFNISSSVTGNEVNGTTPIDLNNNDHIDYRKFSVPFQGGFDGYNPAREIAIGGAIRAANTQGFNLTNSTSSGSVEYKRALNILSNPDVVDLNLLVLPGVIQKFHPYIATEAINMCANRGDCFYIMDIVGLNNTVNEATAQAVGLDTNYAAAYYPWVRISNQAGGQVWAPPSVVLPEVYAYSDNVGAEWFAPAGLNRGGIPGAVGVKVRLSQAQRDTLYDAKVNPIAQFPGQGICVWGQKTLQRRASALDRVNVRRLLITVKKFIASSARYLVFEQNTEATRNRFLNIVNPYLAGIQQNSGLTSFRVVMDETNNTPDLIDRNILVGSIYLQPTRTVEFIKLDFNILPTGATFDTI